MRTTTIDRATLIAATRILPLVEDTTIITIVMEGLLIIQKMTGRTMGGMTDLDIPMIGRATTTGMMGLDTMETTTLIRIITRITGLATVMKGLVQGIMMIGLAIIVMIDLATMIVMTGLTIITTGTTGLATMIGLAIRDLATTIVTITVPLPPLTPTVPENLTGATEEETNKAFAVANRCTVYPVMGIRIDTNHQGRRDARNQEDLRLRCETMIVPLTSPGIDR